jgi:hypothetical protein
MRMAANQTIADFFTIARRYPIDLLDNRLNGSIISFFANENKGALE